MPDESIPELRDQLLKLLQEEHIDYDQILKLSSEIATNDPNYVRFTVDASHIKRLGSELVARQETAVSELVKNAYDADATSAILTFENALFPGGSLSIADNGVGMNREQLIDGFMRLSSTDKLRNPVSSKYKRRRAGRKGIGRFAAQRLGSRLVLTTQTASLADALEVDIDWSRFIGNVTLGLVANQVKTVPKVREHGTTLRIIGLIDGWSDAELTRIYRYLVDLIQPFPLAKTTRNSLDDPGFSAIIKRIDYGQERTIAGVTKMVYEYALAEIDASVNSDGIASWSISSKSLNLSEQKLPVMEPRKGELPKFAALKDVHLRAYYYIYNQGLIPRTQNGFISSLAKERGGIRVYRNGFRVLPYGEENDDWLGLDSSAARRIVLPPHANSNFFGFVELRDPEGSVFEETASREGLIANTALLELKSFVYSVLTGAAVRVATIRDRKTLPNQANVSPIERALNATRRLRRNLESLETIAAASSDPVFRANVQAAIKVGAKIVSDIDDATTEQEQTLEALLEDNGMLRILASMGLVIAEFTHEMKHYLPALQADANYFLELHTSGQEHQVAKDLITNLQSFRVYTSYFDRAVAENVRRELMPQELSVVLDQFQSVIQPSLSRLNITIDEPEILDFDLFTCPMHSSEWTSILLNLYTNSKKAILRTNRKGRIFLRAGRVDSDVYVDFADNGDGISPENAERIFDAFFSTSLPTNDIHEDIDEMSGTGLGLKIVRDILTGYGGDINLVKAPPEFATCFRIQVPAASMEVLQSYGL